MNLPELSIVVPVGPEDSISGFLDSLATQTFRDFELLPEYEGNSEEAKAYGIIKARGKIIAFFCTDNRLVDPLFLSDMVYAMEDEQLTGAYPARYDHHWLDPSLTRYFALIGDNDPLCVWLGKNDRQGYWDEPTEKTLFLRDAIGSVGDNGFFVRASLIKSVVTNPKLHFCIDAVEDLRVKGHYTYKVVGHLTVGHLTGDSLVAYLRRRLKYIRSLYFERLSDRRWRMVDNLGDWFLSIWFAMASLLIFPHIATAMRGFHRVRDWAWFWHPVICWVMTCLYVYLTISHLWRRWLSRRTNAQKV